MSNFILSAESTADLSKEYMKQLGIETIYYSYYIDGTEYNAENVKNELFYAQMRGGAMPKTSQVNIADYETYFRSLLEKGDFLHICFSSGLSGSAHNAEVAAENLRSEYPDRKFLIVDSLCASTGFGFLCEMVAELKAGGADLQECADFANDIKHRIHSVFFSTDMRHFKRSGRVSGPAALFASALGICPVMHLDAAGKIIPFKKTKGKSGACKTVADEVKSRIEKGSDIYISNCACPELSDMTEEEIIKLLPESKNKIKHSQIGSVIGSHCGLGTVAVFFVGHTPR